MLRITQNELRYGRSLLLPDNSRVILCDIKYRPRWYQHTQCHFTNHNIFRISVGGVLVWQIHRNEGELMVWDQARRYAEASNARDPWTLSPFTALHMRSPEMEMIPAGGRAPTRWITGSTAFCRTREGKLYELDVRKGVAVLRELVEN